MFQPHVSNMKGSYKKEYKVFLTVVVDVVINCSSPTLPSQLLILIFSLPILFLTYLYIRALQTTDLISFLMKQIGVIEKSNAETEAVKMGATETTGN